LCEALDCNGHGPVDPIANLLMSLVMLFIVNKEDVGRLEYPDAVNALRKRQEDMLARYLTSIYGGEVAKRKLASVEDYAKLAKDFYFLHEYRVFQN